MSEAIVPLTQEDRDWVVRMWEREKSVLGIDPGRAWYQSWKTLASNEFWIGVKGKAFAHYRVRRRDGIAVLYEIAVGEKRQGWGKKLLFHIGFPMELKTDAAHQESNAFYQKLGFNLVGQRTTRAGDKLLNIYRRL